MAGSGGRGSLRWKTLAGKGVHLFQGEERGTTATAASSTKALGDLVGKIPMVYSWVGAKKRGNNWNEDGQTTKMSGNPLKYTGISLNFDLWFGMVRVSNLSWRTWSILSNWTSERSLWNPFFNLYSDVFIYTYIYIYIYASIVVVILFMPTLTCLTLKCACVFPGLNLAPIFASIYYFDSMEWGFVNPQLHRPLPRCFNWRVKISIFTKRLCSATRIDLRYGLGSEILVGIFTRLGLWRVKPGRNHEALTL